MSLLNCRKCKRLAAGLRRLRQEEPSWHNAPVPPAGPIDAALLIVGLAPGKKGANRTGVPFVGDPSSRWLGARLQNVGLLSEDGDFQGVRITNAVKCLPPANRPTAEEIRTCSERYLMSELQEPSLRTVLCLGGVAHRAVNRLLSIRQRDHVFSHGAEHRDLHLSLISSFHPSPLNTQTGRLSTDEFDQVLARALFLSNRVVPSPPSR